VQGSERANPESPSGEGSTVLVRARPLNPLIPVAVAGGFALAGLALSWQQSQATLEKVA